MIKSKTFLATLSIIISLGLSCQDQDALESGNMQSESESRGEAQSSAGSSTQEDILGETDERSTPESEDESTDQSIAELGPDTDESNSEPMIDMGEDSNDSIRFMPLAENGEVVEFVNIERYMGTWYEIATTPSVQQRFCYGTTAEYNYNEQEAWVEVYNRCSVADAEGRLQEIRGRAEVFDQETQAKLEVYFFEQGSPYWIVELDGSEGDDPYQWAVVSVPNKQTIWILSRSPRMEEGQRLAIEQRLVERGYPTDRLLDTPQP